MYTLGFRDDVRCHVLFEDAGSDPYQVEANGREPAEEFGGHRRISGWGLLIGEG